jgi:hypothetical protein
MLSQQLIVIDDYNWDGFAKAMIQISVNEIPKTPIAFYTSYNWANIVRESILYLPK